ncbi:MAG: PKD domain-containing protein, partial [Methanolobus sp.]|nr:PKD domain-containing protein [Methanolobus sp.]
MKKLKTYLTLFAFALFLLTLSSPAALAANIIVDDDAEPAVSGLYLTSKYPDDAACIQAALDSAKSGDTITIREGDYYITKRIYQKDKSLNIIGDGEVTLYLQTAEGVHNGLFFEGSQITKLTATADEGSYQVALSDGSQVRAGDLLKIWKGDLWCPEDYPKQMTGEVYLVKSVSRNTVTLTESLIRDYPDASVIVYRPVEIHIENINIQDCGSTTTHEAITLLYCIDSSVSDCNIRDSGFAGISFYCSFNVKAYDNDVRNCIKPGSGYGIGIWSGTAHSEVYSNYLENCRHTITLNSDRLDTLIRDAYIHHNDCTGGTIPGSLVIDAHPIAIDWIVEYNEIKVQPGYYALNDGALISTFSNNKVYGGYGAVIKRGSVNGGSHVIKDNVIEGTSDSFTYRAWGSGKGETLVITNNSQSKGRYAVYLSSEQPESYENIIIDGNRFSNILNQGVYQKFLINGVNLKISNNTFENIKREGIYLDGNSFTNGDVEIRNNIFVDVCPSSPGSEITIKNIQNVSVSGNQILKVPVAAFSALPASGQAPMNIAFTDTSTGSPTAWNWNFGDYTTNSALQNPTHTYSIAGNY